AAPTLGAPTASRAAGSSRASPAVGAFVSTRFRWRTSAIRVIYLDSRRPAESSLAARRASGGTMELLDALSAQAAFINSEVIPWVLRLVMIGLGLSLTVADFKRVIVFPKAATIGLVAQLVGLPLVAFALAFLF